MVASFVGFTGFTLVMPFLALHFQALGETDVGTVAVWTGVTLGVTPLVAALCAPLWGRVGDRFGNKILVQRSLSSFVLVMGLMAVATQAWQLFALRAVQGLVAGYGALAIAMAARSAPREKMASAIGWVQTAQRVAPAFGPVVGGLLSPVVGLRNTFLVAALVYALAFVLFSYLYREPPSPAVDDEGHGAGGLLEHPGLREFPAADDRDLRPADGGPVAGAHPAAAPRGPRVRARRPRPGSWACCSRCWRFRARRATSWRPRPWRRRPRGW